MTISACQHLGHHSSSLHAFAPTPHLLTHPVSSFTKFPGHETVAPQFADFDAITAAIMDFGLENPVIFNCQVGDVGVCDPPGARHCVLPWAGDQCTDKV